MLSKNNLVDFKLPQYPLSFSTKNDDFTDFCKGEMTTTNKKKFLNYFENFI